MPCTPGSCAIGKVCAQGLCINACNPQLGVDEIRRHLDPLPPPGQIPGAKPGAPAPIDPRENPINLRQNPVNPRKR